MLKIPELLYKDLRIKYYSMSKLKLLKPLDVISIVNSLSDLVKECPHSDIHHIHLLEICKITDLYFTCKHCHKYIFTRMLIVNHFYLNFILLESESEIKI